MTISATTSTFLYLTLVSQAFIGVSSEQVFHKNKHIKEKSFLNHDQLGEYFSKDRQLYDLHERSLKNDDGDDDYTNLCEKYTLKFLKDTTDSKDVCQGYMNAFISADCGSIIEGKSQISYVNGDDDHDDYFLNEIGNIYSCCHTLYNRYTGSCVESEFLSNINLLVVAFTLLLCECAKSLIKKYEIHFIPEAAGCIIVGTVLGLIAHQTGFFNIDDMPFDDNLFLGVLLPPIIFEAALSVNKKEFRRRRLSILMFAICGTLMSSFTAGFMVHFTSKLTSTQFPIIDSLIFGALISSIDPVAILSVLTSLNMCETDTIFILVFGESLLNDGIAITLFKSLVGRYNNEDDIDADLILGAFADFTIVGFGSIFLGLICGVLCLLYFWTLNRILHPVMEVGSFFLWALIPYYICDSIEWSGIVAIVAMGFFMDIYIAAPKGDEAEGKTPKAPKVNDRYKRFNDFSDYSDDKGEDNDADSSLNSVHRYNSFNEDHSEAEQYCNASNLCAHESDELNLTKLLFFEDRVRMSRQADRHVRFVAHLTASLAENSIFAYLGLFLLSGKYYWDFSLVSIGVAAAILSRVLMVFIACKFVWHIHVLRQYFCFPRFKPSTNNNKTTVFGSTVRVSKTVTTIQDPKTQVVLVLAGLRGAVSLALVENVPIYNAVTGQGSQFKPVMKAMTSASIIFTMFFFGGGAYYILKALNLESESKNLKQDMGDVELASPSTLANSKDTESNRKHNKMLTSDYGKIHLNFNNDSSSENTNHTLM